MSTSINDLGDLIKIDVKAIDAIKLKNADKVLSVLTQKSARVADALKAQEARDNAAAMEFAALQDNPAHIELIRVYGAHVHVAVEPIEALDAIEAAMTAEIGAIKDRYADTHRDAQAAADVALHNVREARAAIDAEAPDAYASVLSSDQITLPAVAARLHKRGRGRGGGGGARTQSGYEEGDTVYLQHADKITGDKYVWQTVATRSGVMVHGVDTADSTAVFDLRTGVDDALRDMEDDTGTPYHPGKAFKTYPPSGKGFVGVEIVDVSQ